MRSENNEVPRIINEYPIRVDFRLCGTNFKYQNGGFLNLWLLIRFYFVGGSCHAVHELDRIMKHIHDVDSSDSLRTLIIQDLKERGIKIPKQKSKENVVSFSITDWIR